MTLRHKCLACGSIYKEEPTTAHDQDRISHGVCSESCRELVSAYCYSKVSRISNLIESCAIALVIMVLAFQLLRWWRSGFVVFGL